MSSYCSVYKKIPVLAKHLFVEVAGKERCVRCLRLANKRSEQCNWASGHVLWQLGKGIFCIRCGAFSFHSTIKLACNCTGKCLAPARLTRMLKGMHPYRNERSGLPRPLCEEALCVVLD